MTRASTARSGLLEQARGLMVSAYRTADGERAVVVAVNYGTIDRRVRLHVDGLPAAAGLAWRPYVTAEDRDLEPGGRVEPGGVGTVPARSVVTFVGEPGSTGG